MEPGVYKFVDEGGVQSGSVSVNPPGTWQWNPRLGGATSRGKWVTSLVRVTNFIADNGVEVCRRQAHGQCEYDGAAPWRGGNRNSLGTLLK
jgi:hypothetical protein